MSLALDTRLVSAKVRRTPLSVWQLLLRVYTASARRAALRRELDRMDAHMLSDLGVSRAQLLFEIEEDTRLR
ncbi:DUF1127 domain-containing protein [Acidisoma sp. 7E03]